METWAPSSKTIFAFFPGIYANAFVGRKKFSLEGIFLLLEQEIFSESNERRTI